MSKSGYFRYDELVIKQRATYHAPRYFLAFFRWFFVGFLTLGLLFLVLFLARFGWHSYHRSWHGKEPYRLVLLQQEGERYTGAAILNYFPDFNRVLLIQLPPTLKIKSLGGLGEYQLQSFLRLQQQEHLPEDFFRESLGHALGIPLQQALRLPVGVEIAENLLPRLLWQVGLAFFDKDTNLADNFRLFQALRSLSKTDIDVVNAEQLRLVSKRTEVDGMEVFNLDPNTLAAFFKKSATPTVPEFADLEVYVENTTRYPALGSHWSRFIESAGFHLVGVGDNTIFRQTSVIRFASKELVDSAAGKYLKRLFPLFLIEVGEIEAGRSEVVIFLGDDAGKYLYEREFLRKLW